MKTVAVTQSNYIPWKGYFDILQFFFRGYYSTKHALHPSLPLLTPYNQNTFTS